MKSVLCATALTLVLSGCASKQYVRSECPKPPAPPAALMQPAPKSVQTLDKIITPSAAN
ncbi:hypothetical protein JK204_07765 [Tatumella sp. JGM16]|nr:MULTISPECIES: lysis system o-spanin lipoprotein Rz1 [unclassified Tatumella]MBS0855973.1 hypothetical protein [Tatumella sp. JGM16]MBS0912952.1 hypothetical protein [Tatumella sp. JGM91]